LIAAGYDVTLLATGLESGTAVPQVTLPKPRNRRERMLRTSRLALRAARAMRADVYHFHDPELIPVALRLSREGARVIYDVHEDYGGELSHREWIPAPVRVPVARLAALAERAAVGHFDRLIASTPTIAAKLPGAITVLVQNYPERDELTKADALPHADRQAAFAYVGDVSRVRGARVMADAISRVRTNEAHLYIVGRISNPHLRAELEAAPSAPRTTLTGHLSRDALRDLLARVRAGLVVLQPTPNHVRAQPTKLYEYMTAGLPVIASDFPLWRDIVTRAQCGFLVDPLDTGALAAAMETLLADPAAAAEMGERGRAAAIMNYGWAPEGARLVEAYRDLLGEAGS
jgi:glycosyltransferase involved in cell wall biosynthesis